MVRPTIRDYEDFTKRVEYDKDTGEMLWKLDPNQNASWNLRLAGRQVGKSKLGKSSGRQVLVRTASGIVTFITRRVAYFIIHGHVPEIVITKNGNPFDDSAENIVEGNPQQVARKRKLSGNSVSKIMGVQKIARGNRPYLGMIHVNNTYLTKTFITEKEASDWVTEQRGLHLFDSKLHGRRE